MPYIYGRNPVLEALQQQQTIQKLYVLYGSQGEKISQIYRLARQEEIPITNADSKKLQQMVGRVNHQGIIALISAVEILPVDLLSQYIADAPPPRSFIGLDRIQDPHNLGAIIRSAEIFGVDGLLLTTRESAPMTDTVVKASAGAALHLPLYKAGNLSQALDLIQQQEIQVYGAVPEAPTTFWEVDFTQNFILLIGGEEKGLPPVLQKRCDTLFHIPQKGRTQSLNASVASGVILAEMLRQRSKG